MISIIICSRNSFFIEQITENVSHTIGVLFEIIAIDNSSGDYGICEAYNLGAQKAKYNILCFMHEDILFHTLNWGERVVNIFNDSTIGTLGVAGGSYLTNLPISWWDSGNLNQHINIYHTTSLHDKELMYSNPLNRSLVDVTNLDGVWICTRKEIWQKILFDSENLPGFHGYDLSYCINAFYLGRICVTFDIDIEHFSLGSINDTYISNIIKLVSLYKDKLPLGKSGYSNLAQKDILLSAMKISLKRMIKYNISKIIIAKYAFTLVAIGVLPFFLKIFRFFYRKIFGNVKI